jgi:hypothetical protein
VTETPVWHWEYFLNVQRRGTIASGYPRRLVSLISLGRWLVFVAPTVTCGLLFLSIPVLLSTLEGRIACVVVWSIVVATLGVAALTKAGRGVVVDENSDRRRP